MTKRNVPLNLASGALAFLFALATLALPASARDSFVQDGGGLFSAATVSSLNTTLSDFNRQTGKEVVVVTVPSLDGEAAQTVAEKTFAQQQVNGVLIFLAKAEKKDGIIGDRASRAFFPSGSFDSVRQAMRGYFRTGDFDTGITTGVNLVLDQYRSHERSLNGSARQSSQLAPAARSSSFGGGMSLFWLILILLAGFLIIRAIFRAMSGPRVMPPGYGGQPGYGPGPGYGMGGGYPMGGGGGGSFFSGLLGGLGGAFLGNELFGRGNEGIGGGYGGEQAGFADPGAQADASGWQSDAGQADMGSASFGDYGSSGGGFDGGGGGFDGGGGGDSGGGW